MTIFKITSKHITKYAELEYHDLGMYGVKVADDKEIMVYESKAVAQRALEYFQKSFKK